MGHLSRGRHASLSGAAASCLEAVRGGMPPGDGTVLPKFDLGQPAPSIKTLGPVLQIAAGKFNQDHGVHPSPGTLKRPNKGRAWTLKVIDSRAGAARIILRAAAVECAQPRGRIHRPESTLQRPKPRNHLSSHVQCGRTAPQTQSRDRIPVQGRPGSRRRPPPLPVASMSEKPLTVHGNGVPSAQPAPSGKKGVAERSITLLMPISCATASSPEIQRRVTSLFSLASVWSPPSSVPSTTFRETWRLQTTRPPSQPHRLIAEQFGGGPVALEMAGDLSGSAAAHPEPSGFCSAAGSRT